MAKKVKDISPEKISGEINRIANNYTKYASWFEDVNAAKENNIDKTTLWYKALIFDFLLYNTKDVFEVMRISPKNIPAHIFTCET